jgi:hypothetical protein
MCRGRPDGPAVAVRAWWCCLDRDQPVPQVQDKSLCDRGLEAVGTGVKKFPKIYRTDP